MLFDQFAATVFELFARQAYAEALAIIEREAHRYPEVADRPLFWQACIYCTMGQPDRALQVLQEGVRAGLWWNDRQLLGDNDLAPLHGRPAFDELVAVCRERLAAARESARPMLDEYLPEQRPAPLLAILHGNDGSNWLTRPHWAPAVAEGWHLALAQSSQVWSPSGFVWNDREKARSELQAHLAQLGADPGRTVLGGFSRGAGTALWLALTGAVPARGFVAVAPALPQLVQEAGQWAHAAVARGVRGYILIGEEDSQFLPQVQEAVALLRSRGMACELDVRPGLGHDYPEDFAAVLRRALAFVTGD